MGTPVKQEANGAATAPTGFSLTFATTKKKAVIPQGAANGAKEEVHRELILGLTDGLVEPAERSAAPGSAGKKQIPKIPNTFEVGSKRFNPNRYIPEAVEAVDNTEKFELAGPEEAQQNVVYGLIKREQVERPAGPSVTSREWEDQRFKEDVEALPDEATLESYEAMPIEEFGEALMRGMGWTEGRPVGRNASAKVIEAKEYVSRPPKLGLGARPAEPESRPGKRIKPGEQRQPKKDMVYYDEHGVQKHVKTLDAKLVEREREGPYPGKTMRLVAGHHAGLLCIVLAIEPKVEGRSQRASVRLVASQETVNVRVKELGDKNDAHPDEAKDKKKEKKEKDRHKDKKSKGHRQDQMETPAAVDTERHQRQNGSAEPDRRGGGDIGAAPAAPPRRAWLAPHILVRIVDKKLRSGRLYLKKAEVVDVPRPGVCSLVLLESGEGVADVDQGCLETIVPKQEGARVLILKGEARGQRARLLKRNADTAAAAVQLVSDFSVVKVSFDDIASYVGEAGEEE